MTQENRKNVPLPKRVKMRIEAEVVVVAREVLADPSLRNSYVFPTQEEAVYFYYCLEEQLKKLGV